MWVAEFKVWHEGSTTLRIATELGVKISNYYLNSYTENGREWILKVSVPHGPKKEEFMRMMQKDKRMQVIKIERDQVFYRIPAMKAFHHAVLDKSVFFVKPIIADAGWEYWTLASIEKKHLTGLFQKVGRIGEKAKIILLSLRQMPLNFFIPALFTDLTGLQKKALDAAFQCGYYSYPRKISVEALAEKLRIPRTTLQEHLRKAEVKLINSVYGGMKY